MTITENNLLIWQEARSRFRTAFMEATPSDLTKKLANCRNTAGFLIRHVADVELLFAKNIFGLSDLDVMPKTLIAQRDTGEWTNFEELIQYQQEAEEAFRRVLLSQTDDDWSRVITTAHFGSRTKAELFGRIISHSAYHAGQLVLTLKNGQSPSSENGPSM